MTMVCNTVAGARAPVEVAVPGCPRHITCGPERVGGEDGAFHQHAIILSIQTNTYTPVFLS